MGRSVDYVNDSEFVVYTHFDIEEGFEDDAQWMWDEFKDDLTDTLMAKFPSLSKCDTWNGRECHGFLKNDFGTLYISEYCGLVSLSFKLDEPSYYDEKNITGLGARWALGMERTLEAMLGERALRLMGRASNGEAFYERVAA